MTRILLFLSLLTLPSCFLFRDYRRSSFRYSENGVQHQVALVVPRHWKEIGHLQDSAGNLIQTYRYCSGALLYFERTQDTASSFQPINYDENIPRNLGQTVYYKGIDSTGTYWRESRMPRFRAGYRFVQEGEDGTFDSSLNYFMLRAR